MVHLIGNTGTVRLYGIERRFKLKCELYAKAEYKNPGGSIKDRVAKAILYDAKERGILKKGYTIAEATSGNTGIALAMIGAKEGWRVKIIMPSSASFERIKLISAFGADVILTDAKEGMKCAIDTVKKMQSSGENIFIPNQFNNALGVECHRNITAKELLFEIGKKIDFFISGVGTGATLVGIGRYLKEMCDTRIIAVEPKESMVLSGGVAGTHGIDGIGAGFTPPLYDANIVDGIEAVASEEAYEMARELARCDGILAGISTGANIAAAVRIGRENVGKITTVIADRGERYFSRGIFGT